MILLERLFQDFAQAVDVQESAIQEVDAAIEDVVEEVPRAIEDIDAGIEHAKTRNRTRLWVVGIVCGIIVIGAVVSLVVVRVVLK